MDNGDIALVRQLLLRAGMAMEDICDLAILTPEDRHDLIHVIKQVEAAVNLAAKLVRSAAMLMQHG